MKLLRTSLSALALGGAAALLLPGRDSLAYSTSGVGPILSVSQRDFRVHNNFADPATNNNTTQDPQFPGWDGAEEALWKACIEWGSGAHGNGSGDPTQANLGDGGANFDAYYAGAAADIGTPNDNIHSAISSCMSGVLAFTEIPTADGWRIRYCDSWEWHDGPGDNPTGFDLQGVATHEYGHALGLGHSNVNGATMWPSTSGGGSSNFRSIEADDIAGVQFIYGAKYTPFKPLITGVSVSGNQATITGVNFSQSGGEVWFTNKNATAASANPRLRLTGVIASNGGTRIDVTIPNDAGKGDVLVKRALHGGNSLSNAFPFDGQGAGTPLSVSGVTPASIPNLIPGTAETISISGAGFTAASTIEIDGLPIAGSFTFAGANTLTFEWEPLALGPHTLTVRDGAQSDSIGITAVANSTPALQIGNGDLGATAKVSVQVTMGGQPGELHYVLVSDSNVPSVLPGTVSLGLGNGFTQLFAVGLFVMDAGGLASTTAPLTGVVATTLHWQSLRILLPIQANLPLQESNLQRTFTP